MRYTVFGKRLRQLRNQHGLTWYELCTALNVNVHDLERVENGDYLPGPSNMERIACFLGIAPMTLIRFTEAEGPYIASRVPAFIEPVCDKDRYEHRALLSVLLHMQDALMRLYRALWRQKVYHPHPLFEAMRADLTPRCESVRDMLGLLAYADIAEYVQFPDRILESAQEAEAAGRKPGELAKSCWRPMLHRAQQWIVRELADIGGSLTAAEIVRDEIVGQIRRELALILEMVGRLERANTHASIMHLFGSDAERYMNQVNAASLP